jgi:8-oxo-dGTP pyrophosphatase MutT (NUDIX family)
MQMKRTTIWSTAVAAAATTTTVLFCSPSSGDSASRQQQKHSSAFASAFAVNAPLNSSGGSSKSSPGSTTPLSSFSTVLNAAASSLSTTTTYCEEGEGECENESIHVTEIPFDESVLSHDHYNGVTIDLDKYHQNDDDKNTYDDSSTSQQSSFSMKLNDALTIWKAEGRKGIWIHANTESAKYIPDCIDAGFQFHKILPKNNNGSDRKTEESNLNNSKSKNSLVLSHWLPTDTPSRLPHGPTHQVGVGVILLNPSDPSQMLVVKELSGPAAKYNIWKMPTGLVDPQEYVPEAASRELLEETGIEAKMNDILCIRQAHRSNADTSDMFFVCKMTPLLDHNEVIQWKRQETEIADIRWMSVKDYCEQDHWQGSPLYETLNDCVLRASMQETERQQQDESKDGSKSISIEHRQLELGFGRTDGKSQALFLPQQQHQSALAISTKKSNL